MFVTFIPRASFPVRRQPNPTLQTSIKRNVGSYDRRSPPPVPIDARPSQVFSHSTCARNCGRTIMCLWTGSRKLSATKTSAWSFWDLLLKPERPPRMRSTRTKLIILRFKRVLFGSPEEKAKLLESRELDKLVIFLSGLHRGSAHCGSKSSPGSCRPAVFSHTPPYAFRVATLSSQVLSLLKCASSSYGLVVFAINSLLRSVKSPPRITQSQLLTDPMFSIPLLFASG